MKESEFDDIIGTIAEFLYNDGIFAPCSYPAILGWIPKLNGIEERDQQILLNKLRFTGLFLIELNNQDKIAFDSSAIFRITLNEKGKEVMNEFGSYLKYLREKKSIKRNAKIDRILNNRNIVILLIIGIGSFLLNVYSAMKEPMQSKPTESIQLTPKQFDSLQQEIRQLKRTLETQTAKDTGTSK